MDSVELIDKKNQLKIQAEAIIGNAEKESRKLDDDEKAKFEALKNQMEEVDNEIRKINEKLNKETNKRNMENFSLLKAINDIANNRQLDERSQEVVNEGISEMRKSGLSYSGQIVLPVTEARADVQATVEGAGQEVVAEDKLNILEPLRASLVMTQAGATYMTGLVGNVSIPVYSGSNVGWAGEIEAAKDGAGTFSEVTLSPKRITAFLDVSKQFLLQDSASAEALLRADIVRAIANKLEATILGDKDGSATQPKGLFYDVADYYDISYESIVELVAYLEQQNVTGDIKFILSPLMKALLKTTKKDEGSGIFVMEDGEIDGLPVLSTSACMGLAIGNWADYVIAQWGGIDLTIDPYSQATNGKVRLVVNAYFDAKPRREEAFLAATYRQKPR